MTNIFDVIRNAFLVASTDNPDEFLNHRDEMVEMIHTWSQCYSGRALEAERVDPDRLGEDDGGSRRRPQEEIKIVGSVDEPGTSKQHEKGKRKVRLYDDDEDEEPSDEPEKEERGIGEDMRIKELVMKHKGEEADDILLELLRQLRTLKMSVNTIQVTGIARELRDLRKHMSEEIKQLFKALIKDQRHCSYCTYVHGGPIHSTVLGTLLEIAILRRITLYDSHVGVAAALDSEANPSHTNMDEEELFSAKSTPVGVSKEARRSRANLTSKPKDPAEDAISTVNPQVEGHRPQKVADAGTPKEVLSVSTRVFFSFRSYRVCLTHSTCCSTEVVASSCSMLTESDKLETIKRKLKEGYREAENAKRQRRIQIMEPHELPEPLPHGIEGPETGKRHYRGRSGRWYRWH
ncbi:hypothetical protein BHM03_00023407 [Ensete ventricosum]|nr:hypothetical protein BHM03_00023407 [Ensete ventricosum]